MWKSHKVVRPFYLYFGITYTSKAFIYIAKDKIDEFYIKSGTTK